jgi:glycosyltransferase involved in cell wall biosynthesis
MVVAAQPLVSVVIPAFNDEKHIAQTLRSALDQDYQNLEILVIDDGSTDGTRDIVSMYVERSRGRVRLLTQQNQGAAAARNLGIKDARGLYVAFLDADDVWWRSKLSMQVNALMSSGYKMAYSRFIVWHADASGEFPAPESEFARSPNPQLYTGQLVTGWAYAELLLDCLVWTSTVVVERAALLQSGLFDVTLRKGQDYDLWLRLSRQIPMLGLEQATALYRTHSGSITYRLSDECFEYRILAGAVARWGESGPDHRSPPAGLVRNRLRRILFNHGLSHYRHGKPAVAAKCFAQLMRNHGLQFRPSVYLALSLYKQWRLPGVTTS